MNLYPIDFEEKSIRPILDNGCSKVVKLSFPKGKILQKHKTASDLLVFVLQGHIRFTADGEEAECAAFNMISLGKNIEHSLEALQDSLVMLVLTPSPQPQ